MWFKKIKIKEQVNDNKIFIKELRPDMTECRIILVEKKKNEKNS